MRDAMVALRRRGIDSAALVHQHTASFTSSHESFSADGHDFPLLRAGRWAKLLFTPISPGFPWHLRQLIKSFKPDILHLHVPNPSAFWALLLPSARRIPWVVHWHSDVMTEQSRWLKLFYGPYRLFERAMLKHATVIAVTSTPYRDSSQPLQQWLDKCQVIPLGIDTDRLGGEASPDRNNKLSQGSRLQVLAVGRLTYYKGFRYLIEAASLTDNIDINLVGDGDQADELKRLTASLHVQDRINFLGVLNDHDLADQMTCADCVCLPSIERTEAFGIILLEAMYYGKATVISDVKGSGMGWIVDAGITGLKVAPADSKALAAAFDQLAEDREVLLRMGQAGQDKFSGQFDINHAIKQLIKIYHNVEDTTSA